MDLGTISFKTKCFSMFSPLNMAKCSTYYSKDMAFLNFFFYVYLF